MWLTELINKETETITAKDYFCNFNKVEATTQSFLISHIKHWKILKVYDEFPKEFLI